MIQQHDDASQMLKANIIIPIAFSLLSSRDFYQPSNQYHNVVFSTFYHMIFTLVN